MKINWAPVTVTGGIFDNGAGKYELEALRDIFGETIKTEDVPILRKMARISDKKFYDAVADVVAATGPIKVWGEDG